jgi:hypothetical protein
LVRSRGHAPQRADSGKRGTPLQASHLTRTVALAAALATFAAPSSAQDDAAQGSANQPTVHELHERLEAMNEQMLTLQSDMDKLKRFKFSGYLQARWETGETQSDTVGVSGTPLAFAAANNERFYIRRGRLKLTYDSSPTSQAVIYFDGNTGSGTTRNITLLEAYLTLMDPWTPDHRHTLTVGQFNVPFGYEIERSSSARELPERSRAENVLFAGERDRGIKLVNPWTTRFETVVAVLNGGGVNHGEFPNTDPTRSKDVVGRARVSLGVFDAAASGYVGRNTIPLTGPEIQTDKSRYGADAQSYYELPRLGGGSVRGEVYVGKELNPDSVSALLATPAPGTRILSRRGTLATDVLGWYVMWVQNLGERFQAAARYEQFDRNTDKEHDQYERASFGLNWFYGGSERVTVAYDVVTTERERPSGSGRYFDPKDNLWTVQFQHKF